MKTMTGLLAALLLMILACPLSPALAADAEPDQDVLTQAAEQVDPQVRADILKLMQLTGSAQVGQMMGVEMAQQVIGAYQQTHPGLSPEAFQIMKEVLVTVIKEEAAEDGPLMAALTPVYAKYYTPEEIRELLAFYDSPVGKKSIEVMPQLTREGMLVGRQYSQIMGKKMVVRLQERFDAEGIVLKSAEETEKGEMKENEPKEGRTPAAAELEADKQ